MKDAKRTLFSGAASEVITPFSASGAIDFQLLAQEVDFLISNGITGLFVNGLASEALMMPYRDLIESARVCISSANKRVPVAVNVISNSVDSARTYVSEIEKLGADAIVITPPLVYKYSEESLYNYYTRIAEHTLLPIYLYNAPETGNKLSPSLISRLFKDIPHLRGYKDSTQDIIHLQEVIRLIGPERHFELLAGSDAQIFTTMALGGVGVFSLVTCVFPQLIVDEVAACARGDYDAARRLQQKILRIREALKTGPFMAAYKFVSCFTGSPLGKMKDPLSDVSETEQAKILSILQEQNIIGELLPIGK